MKAGDGWAIAEDRVRPPEEQDVLRCLEKDVREEGSVVLSDTTGRLRGLPERQRKEIRNEERHRDESLVRQGTNCVCPRAERIERWQRMMTILEQNTIVVWRERFLGALEAAEG